jgi:predicted ATPase
MDVDGMAKPLTARIVALAKRGQTLVSETAASALASRVPLMPLGHWRFKGSSEPMALFEPAASALGPPPDGEKAWGVMNDGERWVLTRDVANSLPAERDRFIGRSKALIELAATFAGGARLVTVLGIGGSGKTRLALRHGWDALGGHPGGVWFCDLSQAVNFDGIIHAVAQGLQLPLGGSDPVPQIGGAIASRGVALVILDNFEQVARHAEESLGRWLQQATGATFLVTSREVLGITGECTLALPPLPDDDAAELFVQRARGAVSDFSLEADDQAAVAELVRLLDGLPLSIELAAARVRVMSPRTMLARMGERFKLLATPGGRRDRQATLRATLDWSWELLSEAERSALAQLSVFEGGFTLEAAEAVVDLTDSQDAPWEVDAVHALVQKSLVRRLNERRFDLLKTVQEYVHPELGRAGMGQAVAAHTRHARWFAALSEAEATSDLGADADNLVVACRRSVASGRQDEALGNLVNAWAVLRLTGPFHLALQLAEAVAAMPEMGAIAHSHADVVAASALDALGRSKEAQARIQSALRRLPAGAAATARALCVLGEATANLGQSTAAERELTDALHAAQVHDDIEVQCRAHNALGALATRQARADRARPHYEQALELARRLGDKRWQGGLLGNLGMLDHMGGQTHQARSKYEQALAHANQTGDRRWEANTRCNLGLLLHDEGRSDEARVQFEAALQMARHMGHRQLEGTVLCNLGLLHEARNDLASARLQHEAAVRIAHDCGDSRNEGLYRAYLGQLLARLGLAADAKACLEAGAQLLQAEHDTAHLALLECKRALALAWLQDAEAGLAAVSRAESLMGVGSSGSPAELASALQAARAALRPAPPAAD